MAGNIWLSTADGNYATASNWSLGHVPIASEDVIIPARSPSIVSGLDQSTVAIGGLYVKDGYDGTLGDPSNSLSIAPSSLFFSGNGLSFIDINASNIDLPPHLCPVVSSVN